MENSTKRDELIAFLEFHVPLQLYELKLRELKPGTSRFNKELRECGQVVSEKGDTILFHTKETAKNVVKLSKAIAMLLLINKEVTVFGTTFKL